MSPLSRGQVGGGRRAVWASSHFLGVSGSSNSAQAQADAQLFLSTEASEHHLEPITAPATLSTGSG